MWSPIHATVSGRFDAHGAHKLDPCQHLLAMSQTVLDMYPERNMRRTASWLHSSQRTLICVSVTSSGRLLTMILLCPDAAAARGAAAAGALGAVLRFCTPPVGAAMAALALFLAMRGLRSRRPGRPPAGLVSCMIWSRDWSSFPDMVKMVCELFRCCEVR